MDLLSVLAVFFYIYVAITVILLLLDNRDTSTTFAWIFVFIIFPILGQVAYLLIGRNRRNPDRKKRLQRQHVKEQLVEILKPLFAAQDNYIKALVKDQDSASINKRKLLQLLYKNSNSVLTTQNRVRVIQEGEEKFDLLIKDIQAARHHIHMEYFIWRSDALTNEIKDLLIKKAKEGVKVKILYDALGSIFLSPLYIKELRRFGIAIYPYYNFLSLFTFHTINYRNHRKIVVIDGKIGYCGGMNMGKEYVDGGGKYACWRDTHMRVEGEVVLVLQSIFLTSWLNTTKEDLIEQDYFPSEGLSPNNLPVQVTTSGPDSEWESVQQLYFSLISSAEKNVYIQSPYFLPDKSIEKALTTAALSGLDVKLMMTGVPDRKLPFWSAHTFFDDLLKAGVKIYQYNKGFLHSKTISVDGDVCSIGTANMDMRSFNLNYELNTLIYDREVTRSLNDDFARDLKECREVTREYYNSFSSATRFRNSVARLFAPLM